MKTNKDKFKQNQEDNAKMMRLLEHEEYELGYNFAAGELLRSDNREQTVEVLTEDLVFPKI